VKAEGVVTRKSENVGREIVKEGRNGGKYRLEVTGMKRQEESVKREERMEWRKAKMREKGR
jgi:hypothetical protein